MSDTFRNSRAGGRSRQSSAADRIMAVQNARNKGTGARRGGSGRRRGRGRGRGQGPDMAKIVLIAIGVVIFLICVAVGLQSCARSGRQDAGSETSTEETTTEPETEIEAEITVNGIQIHGLTKSEAMEKVLADMGWKMKVTFGDSTEELPNLMEANVDAVIEEALAKKESGDYTVQTDGLDDAVQVEVKALAAKWDVEPKNGSIASYDKSTEKFTFAGAQTGKKIDQEKLASDITAAMKAGEYDKTITATANEVQPEITEAQARDNFKKIGTYTTTTTTNKDRNENIRLACAAINGTILQPGGEFSFNKMTGNRTTEKGYKPAGAYSNGVVVQEPGGGVCQVSSTMYRVAFQSGMQITYRRSHTFEPNYVTPGQDAAISWDIPDFRFINTSKAAIGIRANYSNRKMTVSFYGVPVLEEGITWSLESEKTDELPPPEPTYVEDPTLDPGTEVTQKAGTNGSRWITYKIVSKNGTVVEKTEDHAKTYKGHAAVIRRNTGSVKVAASETTVAESTSAAIDGMPDGYVPGESVAPESSAAATTAASTSGSETKSTHSETKSTQSETTAASTTAAATTAATEAATTAAPTTAASTTAAAPNGPGDEATATPSTEAIGNIAGFPGDGN